MKLGDRKITIRVTALDIARGECGNRRKCVIAQAANRIFELGGKGYINVNANAVDMTKREVRYRHRPPRTMIAYLRKFDRIGEKQGLEAARAATEPAAFVCTLVSANRIPPKATNERKEQINEARRARVAKLRARGIYPGKPERRYVGV